MERKLEELVTRLEKLSDVRNRDRSNFVTFTFEHPSVETPTKAQKVIWAVIASQLEPLAELGAPLPINLIWICYDSGSSDYKKVFKRRSNVPSNERRGTWIEIFTHAEIFEEPQFFEFDPSLIGPVGPEGPEGPQGIQGEIGPEGKQGPAGMQGPRGSKGDVGDSSYQAWLDTGKTGSKEDFLKSLQGAQGLKGDRGEKGDKGDRGEQGPQGEQGVQGEIGEDSTIPGPQGIQGERGEKGDKGDTGEKGIQGERGEKGDKGDKGDRGEIGLTGNDGADAGSWVMIPDGEAADLEYFKAAPVCGFDAYAATDMPTQSNGSKNYFTGLSIGLPDPNGFVRGFQMVHGWNGELGRPLGSYVRIKDDTQVDYGAWARLLYSEDIASSVSDLIPFTIAGTEVKYSYERLIQDKSIVENSTELAAAKTVSTSLAAIYNTWKRFSHGNTNTYPFLASELSSWSYDSSTDTLQSTVNSSSYIGFVSAEKYEAYSHVVTLSSTNSDDDAIMVVLAFYADPATGREHTISAVRTAGGVHSGRPWLVVYNQSQSDQYVIRSVGSEVLKTFGNAGGAGSSSGLTTGWSGGRATKVFVTRNGNEFKLRTSELYLVGSESDAYVPAADLTFNLNEDPRLAKFIGPQSYGYACSSQQNSKYSNIQFTQNGGDVFDATNGDVWTFNPVSGAYELNAAKMPALLPKGRMYRNDKTSKLFFYNPSGIMQLISRAAAIELPYDLAAGHIGRLPANAMISRYVANRSFRFVAGMIGSQASVGVAPTAQVIMSLRKNGVEFGTVTFAAGAYKGIFASGADVGFLAGDVLTIHAPASVDSTFADSSYTLAAKLV